MPKHYRPAGKKKEGNAAKYVTRSQAIKQLQVTLPLFRRLCILKGIFPRDPKKKVKGTHQTYYHVKDISFLRHEPLLETFRDIRVHERKVKKARAKKNKELANSLLTRKPGYSLDRLIRDRYPRFVDALGDLDDCLSMVHLFATLPASEQEKIGVKRIHNCRRLCLEWQAYITRTHRLRKTFISVKGMYYEVEVEGQQIRWITPHKLQQVVPEDIDFGIMLTFLEFYETLLEFVNFKLYQSIDVKYPPILDHRLEALAEELYAMSRYVSARKAISLDGQATSDLQLPSHEDSSLTSLVEEDDDDDEETKKCKSLFKNMKFFLSREVPKESLLFVISAFGGMVSWEGEGAPFSETDQSITYQIVDRPTVGHKILTREYVQPQWIYDCVNARIILPTEQYWLGSMCPPHLSPFVEYQQDDHVPDYAYHIKRLQALAKNEILAMPGTGAEDIDDRQGLLDEAVMSRAEANDNADRKRKLMECEKKHLDEMKQELKRIKATQSNEELVEEKQIDDEPMLNPDQLAEDVARIERAGLSRKRRGLIEAIEINQKRKKASNDILRERKRKLEGAKASAK